MRKRFKIFFAMLMAFSIFSLTACSGETNEKFVRDVELNLSVGDTYNWEVMGYSVKAVGSDVLSAEGNVITAENEGTTTVELVDTSNQLVSKTVKVYKNATQLGGKFSLDKGMFFGKKVIAFGDSITDYFVYPDQETYFVRLCEFLGVASDPFDVKNVNLACASACISYGPSDVLPSGVERITLEKFTDIRGERVALSNIKQADLCVIHFGANDINWCRPLEYGEKDVWQGTDKPTEFTNATSIRGGYYFMVAYLHMMNPNLKILLLPPTYRTCSLNDPNYEYNEEKTDAYSHAGGYNLSDVGRAVKEVGDELGAKTVNWYYVFDSQTFAVGGPNTADGIHPTVAGHKMMFDYLIAHAND